MVDLPRFIFTRPTWANICFCRTAYEADEGYVTGTFDDWKKACKLTKTSSGYLEAEIVLPLNEKVIYKVNPPSINPGFLKHVMTLFSTLSMAIGCWTPILQLN